MQLIYSMTNKTADHLRANPLLIAHCIGAMKIITAISISQEIHEKFSEHKVLDCVLSLLSLINSIQLQRLKQQLKTRTERMGQTGILVTEAEDFGDNESEQPVEGNAVSRVVSSPGGNVSTVPEEVKLTASGLRTPVHGSTTDEPTSVKGGSPFHNTLMKKSNTKPLLTESVTGEAIIEDELDEAFSTLTGLSVITLYNCINLISNLEEFREHLSKAGTMRILWCRLVTTSCSSSSIQQIELATEMLLNLCCCMTMLEKYTTELGVELDEQTKTPALVLSADRLEASNPNWTFESVHATMCVGRGMCVVPPFPAGWYYEVTLKCTGILQIGWQTEECRYGPERGVGVGDDKNSCAFDGARCKVWSGPPCEQLSNDYGKEWSYGDVLSCLFSWNGEVSFWLNGVDMGVAFRGLNPGVNWYPAASIAMDQHCCFNFGNKPFRYEMPDGYIAVSHVVSNLVKKASLRLSSCWTPISGSFESIVEEDEEVIDDQELEASDVAKPDDTAQRQSIQSCNKEPSRAVMKEEQPSVLSLEHSVAESNVLFDYQDTSSLSKSSLALSPEPTNNSLTFVTPSSGVFTTPQSSPPKVSGLDVIFPGTEPEPSPYGVMSTGDETANEERPPFEEKHVTSTPYLGLGPLRDSIGKHFEARSRLNAWPQEATLGESFIEPVLPCLYFEAELKFAPCRVKQMGFINVETREKFYCDVHDGHLQFPKSSSPTPHAYTHEQQSFRVPDVVGCAVILSTGQIMFTLDGVATGQFYDFPSSKPSSMVIENLFPYISCTRIRCNYGQRSFLFEDANNKESLVMSGALLHGLVEEYLRL